MTETVRCIHCIYTMYSPIKVILSMNCSASMQRNEQKRFLVAAMTGFSAWGPPCGTHKARCGKTYKMKISNAPTANGDLSPILEERNDVHSERCLTATRKGAKNCAHSRGCQTILNLQIPTKPSLPTLRNRPRKPLRHIQPSGTNSDITKFRLHHPYFA